MESNTKVPNNVSKQNKTRLRVTAMPRNLKIQLSVNSDIQISALFNEIGKLLKMFNINFKVVRVQRGDYIVSPNDTVGENFENDCEITAFSEENENPLNFKTKVEKNANQEEKDNLSQKRNRQKTEDEKKEKNGTPVKKKNTKKPKRRRQRRYQRRHQLIRSISLKMLLVT